MTDRDRVPADKVKETMSESAMNVSGAIRFPHLAARDLEGRSLELPDAFSGASNLVIVAFRREQQAMVDSWIAWWETIAAEHPSLQCYEIPVIATRWSPARPVIDGGMAQAVRAQEARRRTLTVYTDVRRVTDALGIDATDTVTVLLVDADGRLRWRTTGPVSEHSGSELRAALTADSSQDAGAAESLAIEQFEFAFDSQFRPFLALIGVTSGTAHVTLTAEQARGPLRAVDVRNRDRQCARRVPHGPLPLVQGHRTARVVRRPRSHLWHDNSRWCLRVVARTRTGPHSRRPASPPRDHPHPRRARTVRRVVAPTRRSRVNGHRRRVVVAGATGYIGRRLVAELVADGHHVRCLARTPDKLDAEPWRAEVEVVAGDVLDVGSLAAAFRETDAAYYLVHSIGSQPDWQTRDRTAAENFRDAAAAANLEQIVYLGGLGDDAGGTLSPHLASRHDVGRILATGRVPLTELRAAVVIGSGSASFEMLRHLVEVLPVMTTPRWVKTRVQPIAVRDVLAYLTDEVGWLAAIVF